jgi:hypothetical protein
MHHRTDLPPPSTEHRAAAWMPGQVRWTRLGRVMGYTNTRAKRAAICSAMTNLIWVHPDEIADLLGAAPLRFVIAALLRNGHLVAAATTRLTSASQVLGRPSSPMLIGLQSDAQQRHVLLDLGYEVVYLLRQTRGGCHLATESPMQAIGCDNGTDRDVQ